ncbi:MAG: L-threonylcarbamoyladenylate synthase [Gaiellaceae bacterium]|nr:L-threonylcarbamoyladenylate synthase [Gaiellaceae bacterium]
MAVEAVTRSVIDAIKAGKPVLLPTDTVYGLATSAYSERHVERVYRLKGRDRSQPSALLAGSVEGLLDCVPELRGRAGVIARTLLPGPYTLILTNPARRFRWLCGERTDVIGVRVPVLSEPTAYVLERVGCVLATSANDPGGPDPLTIGDVPERIRAGCAAVLDAGPLPGTPSTVIDFTGPEPYVIREGAGSSAEAIERVRAALGR